jgi:hypothetical protein
MRSDTTQLRAPGQTGPRRAAQVALIASMLGAGYLDFFYYRAQGYLDPAFFNERLSGQGSAPDQYRVGIVWLAHLLVMHLHIALTMAVASIDTVSGLIAALVLFAVLERSPMYRDALIVERWLGAITFVMLVQWFLAWLLWLQKPETLPASLLVAVLLWLWQPQPYAQPGRWRSLLCIAMTFLLATFRADIACLLNLGIFLFLIAKRRLPLSLPRAKAIATSLTCALIAGALQLYFVRLYPHASYGRVKMWQLRPNLIHASRWPPFVIFLLPLFWMGSQVLRRRFKRDAAGLAFLCGAVLFGALWFTIGKIDEVRIFLPFALALAPLTAQMVILHVRSEREDAPAPSAPQN